MNIGDDRNNLWKSQHFSWETDMIRDVSRKVTELFVSRLDHREIHQSEKPPAFKCLWYGWYMLVYVSHAMTSLGRKPAWPARWNYRRGSSRSSIPRFLGGHCGISNHVLKIPMKSRGKGCDGPKTCFFQYQNYELVLSMHNNHLTIITYVNPTTSVSPCVSVQNLTSAPAGDRDVCVHPPGFSSSKWRSKWLISGHSDVPFLGVFLVYKCIHSISDRSW